ncbi:hypothetical protein C8R32_11611 [Nitrosospira sp. Nsp5]|uniref:Uncharacterized protein n=1 Tax=Nitrosospira multiformis TaxID=1231 RepID=A0ABY0TEK4_9PROT|nr:MULTISPECIES: hypothetical protein [Nitrosospira]PTR05765.1 hypothetical protein C8R32_11611 [Nitrosospira sp. Nsp5]SDQ62414.1 hypothetical protein SAMN05216402_1594 [Nitrosospira multiformis]
MTTFPNSPKLLKAGIVLVDVETSRMQRVISLQYNPDSLTRRLQVQGTGEGGERSEALRLKGPAAETITLEAEIDATDQLEFPERNPNAVQFGIHPQLALLETLVHPRSEDLQANNTMAGEGTIEILPTESLLTLFVWSAQRILPVRITEFSITEEAFDPSLNPIRAKVSLGMRVLSVDDVGFTHRAGQLYMGYLRNKESLAGRSPFGTLTDLGLTRL